jgi:hypothetical protein
MIKNYACIYNKECDVMDCDRKTLHTERYACHAKVMCDVVKKEVTCVMHKEPIKIILPKEIFEL